MRLGTPRAEVGAYDTAVLSLAVDVVDLGHETLLCDGRVEDVVEVDRKDA